jgi:hypothetical protein
MIFVDTFFKQRDRKEAIHLEDMMLMSDLLVQSVGSLGFSTIQNDDYLGYKSY